MKHKLTLTKPEHTPTNLATAHFIPLCVCGWRGLTRPRRVAEAEYRNHKRQQESKAHDGSRPRQLTPYEDLPPELQAPHPDIAPFEQAVEKVVERLTGECQR